jgi:hypothetical protein
MLFRLDERMSRALQVGPINVRTILKAPRPSLTFYQVRERIAKRKGDLARRRSNLAAAAGFQAADLQAQYDTDRRKRRDRYIVPMPCLH